MEKVVPFLNNLTTIFISNFLSLGRSFLDGSKFEVEFESKSNQTTLPTPDALRPALATYHHDNWSDPSPVPPRGTVHRQTLPPWLLPDAAHIKRPPCPPLLRVSPHEPPFSVQKACMTQHLTALPLVRLDRRRRLRSIVKLRPPPPLQPPHGELPPLAIVVLRRWPLVSPRPPPPLML
jgi:hypothetical protein